MVKQLIQNIGFLLNGFLLKHAGEVMHGCIAHGNKGYNDDKNRIR